MTKNELVEVVKITGINLQDLFSLKIPKNASKEQIELIQNLENIKRQRDVEDEVKKLKEKVRGSDAIALEEEKNKLLQKSFNIVKKGIRKPVGFKNIVKKLHIHLYVYIYEKLIQNLKILLLQHHQNSKLLFLFLFFLHNVQKFLP